MQGAYSRFEEEADVMSKTFLDCLAACRYVHASGCGKKACRCGGRTGVQVSVSVRVFVRVGCGA